MRYRRVFIVLIVIRLILFQMFENPQSISVGNLIERVYSPNGLKCVEIYDTKAWAMDGNDPIVMYYGKVVFRKANIADITVTWVNYNDIKVDTYDLDNETTFSVVINPELEIYQDRTEHHETAIVNMIFLALATGFYIIMRKREQGKRDTYNS